MSVDRYEQASVTWKRPDGYHGASPDDFGVAEVDGRYRLWLHKSDKDQYPFRISGGWEEDESSVKLNNMVNLIGDGQDVWASWLAATWEHSMKEGRKEFYDSLVQWLTDLQGKGKGDTWEVEIINGALRCTLKMLQKVKEHFLNG
ncbi:MAG: hypothetical protein CMP10_16605 [Zetaproteobacteria bacterium]|nr:hypothetical protein [Pseudobdellovibrionaceae bacterium]